MQKPMPHINLIVSEDSNRQNFKNFFFVNGCIYICDANKFLKNKKLYDDAYSSGILVRDMDMCPECKLIIMD